MNLARYTSLRYAEIATALDNTVQGRVRERLLGALHRLAWQYGFRSAAGRSLAFKLTHTDIANLVASTRETVSLELAALTRMGSISRRNGKITVLDHEPRPSRSRDPALPRLEYDGDGSLRSSFGRQR